MESYCLPLISYGFEALNLNIHQLHKFNMGWYKRIFNYKCWESVKELQFLCSCLDFTQYLYIYRVFKKSSPLPKTFRNIFTSIRSFCMKFCRFFWQFIHIHIFIYTNLCRFILIFHQMALIFPRVPIVFTLSSIVESNGNGESCNSAVTAVIPR